MGEWTCEGEVTPWRQDDGTQLREPMRCQARCDVKLLNLMRLSVCLWRSTGRSRDVKMGQSTLTGEPKRAKGLHRAFVPTEVENSSSVGLPGEWASYVVDFVLYF